MYCRATLLAIAFLVSMSPDSVAAHRVALVIGNGSYSQIPPLRNTVNDASDISSALEAFGFDVIKGINLSLTDTLDAARRFTEKLRGADAAVLFYSGHGLQVGSANYLVPTDAIVRTEADLDFRLVKLDLTMRQMEREAKTSIIILDACRNNPLTRNLAQNMGTRSSLVREGLAQIQAGVGTFIAYATQPGNVASDGPQNGRNSPFTGALISHIRTPGIEIGALMRQVRRSVVEATAGEQVPWDSSSLTSDFYLDARGFAPSPASTTTATANATPTSAPVAVSTEPARTGRTLWNHNGSVMALVAAGSERRFYYQVPRQGIADQGVKPNTMLFRGVLSGSNYEGIAYLFSAKCGSREYRVRGPIEADGRRVVLRGQATRIDPNCSVVGTIPDELVFEYLRKD
jgi:uncharacterized caspase-like protein